MLFPNIFPKNLLKKVVRLCLIVRCGILIHWGIILIFFIVKSLILHQHFVHFKLLFQLFLQLHFLFSSFMHGTLKGKHCFKRLFLCARLILCTKLLYCSSELCFNNPFYFFASLNSQRFKIPEEVKFSFVLVSNLKFKFLDFIRKLKICPLESFKLACLNCLNNTVRWFGFKWYKLLKVHRKSRKCTETWSRVEIFKMLFINFSIISFLWDYHFNFSLLQKMNFISNVSKFYDTAPFIILMRL